jgi:hypothetical protein
MTAKLEGYGVTMNLIARVQSAMIAYFSGDPRRIHHFLKVYSFA